MPAQLPDFLPETAWIRRGDWRIEPVPVDLTDRRVQISGPVDRKTIIKALNAPVRAFMADFADACTPGWENLIRGQFNLSDAISRQISHSDASGRSYRLNEQTATLMVRPRGWHLLENTCASMASRCPARCSISRCILPITTSCSRAEAPDRISICPSWRATWKRACGMTSSSAAQEQLGISARHHQGDGTDRNRSGGFRDGRDSVRTTRARRRSQLRALGLHVQLHQEIQESTRGVAARPR